MSKLFCNLFKKSKLFYNLCQLNQQDILQKVRNEQSFCSFFSMSKECCIWHFLPEESIKLLFFSFINEFGPDWRKLMFISKVKSIQINHQSPQRPTSKQSHWGLTDRMPGSWCIQFTKKVEVYLLHPFYNLGLSDHVTRDITYRPKNISVAVLAFSVAWLCTFELCGYKCDWIYVNVFLLRLVRIGD